MAIANFRAVAADLSIPLPEAAQVTLTRGADTATVRVWFRCDRINIDPTYLDNTRRLDDFRRQMRALLSRHPGPIEGVAIRGTASPEGPYAHNQWLSLHRAAAIRDLIVREFHIPASAFVLNPQGENWQGLRDTLLLDTAYPYRDEVLPLLAPPLENISQARSDRLKRDLKALRGGRVWRDMLRRFYPKLRLSENLIIIDYQEYVANPTLRADLPMFAAPAVAPLAGHLAPVQPAWTPLAIHPALRLPRRELLSVKTNLLFDFAYVPGYDRFCPIPNVGLEVYPLHGHFTYGLSFDFPWWQHYNQRKYFQIRNYEVYSRYYFRSGDIRLRRPGEGAAFKGAYVSAYLHTGLYSICFSEHRGWEGEGFGGGLGAGYVLPLGKREHWRLEAGLQVGYFWTKYDPYQWLCPIDPESDRPLYYYKWYGRAEDFRRRRHRFSWFGPTRVEITLSYDLLYRRRAKKGASFRQNEPPRY